MARMELDPSLNFMPKQANTVHLIGICGTAMGSLAGMLAEKGRRVTGSDQNVYPPMSDFLAGLGIPVMSPYRAENLDHHPDLVVVGNVVTRQNPEAIRLEELGLPYLSLPQMLHDLFLKDKKPLVVAGTHGKTTTSSLAAWVLEAAGRDPGFMIGGILNNFGRNHKLGQGDWFVVEGDEYDTAFFDKVPKFIHYAPYIGILTSVEFDHADIYPDFDAVKAAFLRFVELLPPEGLLVAWGDDPLVREIAGQTRSRLVYYGQNDNNHWQIRDIRAEGRRTRFTLVRPEGETVEVAAPLPGVHNALNTVAVIAALNGAGLSLHEIKNGIKGFQGIKRRQEVRGVAGGVTVLDDFAHHPTAVRETVRAVRAAYNPALQASGGRLTAVFEPRSNTSRRAVFQNEYVSAFDGADLIVLREPADPEKSPENDRFSSEKLAADLTLRGLFAKAFDRTEEILDYLGQILRPGDVVLVMSNGGFDGLHRRLIDTLDQGSGESSAGQSMAGASNVRPS